MKELRDKFPSGKEFLSLSDHRIAEAVLESIVTRAENTDRISTKFLSIGELENIYDSVSLPAASQHQINHKLMQAYQWLLSEGYIMPAPGQPPGVVTVTPKGRSGLPLESKVENKPLIEWAGGARVTLAIVFTDIVDSTALGVQLGDAAMSEVRRRHFARSTALVTKHFGREIKTIGDSVMAVFRSAEAALDYARELQLDPGSSEIQMRAGINIGSVEVTADDVFGTEVTLASRVVGAIRGAEIWLSNRAKEDIDRAGTHRERGLQWQVHDGLELKGIGIQRLWSLASKPSSARISTAVVVRHSRVPSPRKERRVFGPRMNPSEWVGGKQIFSYLPGPPCGFG
jgi:class 3 adenylate cyclase